MLKLLLKRFLEAIPTMFVLVTFSFLLMRIAPGTPFTGERNLPPAVLANIEAKYHLNEPLWMQYLLYLKQLFVGDFGPSFKYKDHTVNELLAQTFPVSVELGVYAFIIAVIVGLTLGIVAALKQNSWIDYLVMAFAMIGAILPSFVKAPIMVLIFALWLGWFPAGGWNDGAVMNMVLPVAALAFGFIAGISRVMRGSMLEVLNSPFIRTARAKGLPMHQVVLKHALRPAMLPVISYLGPAFVGIITGSVVIETVFGLPGVGQLFVNGALNRDYGLVLSLTILVGFLTILFNAIVDILYGVLDPKIRY